MIYHVRSLCINAPHNIYINVFCIARSNEKKLASFSLTIHTIEKWFWNLNSKFFVPQLGLLLPLIVAVHRYEKYKENRCWCCLVIMIFPGRPGHSMSQHSEGALKCIEVWCTCMHPDVAWSTMALTEKTSAGYNSSRHLPLPPLPVSLYCTTGEITLKSWQE